VDVLTIDIQRMRGQGVDLRLDGTPVEPVQPVVDETTKLATASVCVLACVSMPMT
jgi:hypothetical protein